MFETVYYRAIDSHLFSLDLFKLFMVHKLSLSRYSDVQPLTSEGPRGRTEFCFKKSISTAKNITPR